MCTECGRIFCADGCPNYGGRTAERGRRINRCSLCGDPIYEVETFWQKGRLVICEICMREQMTGDKGEA